MAQRVRLRDRVEVTAPARCQVDLAAEPGPAVRPGVAKAIVPEFDHLEVVKVTDRGYDRLVVAKVIDLGYDRPVVVKGTDRGYDRPVVVKVIGLECDRPAVVKVIGLECDRPAVVKATDREYVHLAVAKVIDQGVLRESAILIDQLCDLRSHGHRANGRRDNDLPVGVLRAIDHRDGGHRCIGRPSLARPFGTRGIDRGIAHQDTGGDRLRQQP